MVPVFVFANVFLLFGCKGGDNNNNNNNNEQQNNNNNGGDNGGDNNGGDNSGGDNNGNGGTPTSTMPEWAQKASAAFTLGKFAPNPEDLLPGAAFNSGNNTKSGSSAAVATAASFSFPSAVSSGEPEIKDDWETVKWDELTGIYGSGDTDRMFTYMRDSIESEKARVIETFEAVIKNEGGVKIPDEENVISASTTEDVLNNKGGIRILSEEEEQEQVIEPGTWMHSSQSFEEVYVLYEESDGYNSITRLYSFLDVVTGEVLFTRNAKLTMYDTGENELFVDNYLIHERERVYSTFNEDKFVYIRYGEPVMEGGISNNSFTYMEFDTSTTNRTGIMFECGIGETYYKDYLEPGLGMTSAHSGIAGFAIEGDENDMVIYRFYEQFTDYYYDDDREPVFTAYFQNAFTVLKDGLFLWHQYHQVNGPWNTDTNEQDPWIIRVDARALGGIDEIYYEMVELDNGSSELFLRGVKLDSGLIELTKDYGWVSLDNYYLFGMYLKSAWVGVEDEDGNWKYMASDEHLGLDFTIHPDYGYRLGYTPEGCEPFPPASLDDYIDQYFAPLSLIVDFEYEKHLANYRICFDDFYLNDIEQLEGILFAYDNLQELLDGFSALIAIKGEFPDPTVA